VASVDICGLDEAPAIRVRERAKALQTGLYDDDPLECEIHFGTTSVVLQLGVQTVGQKVASEKPAVGLQFCKPGGMQKRFAWVNWDSQTMTAKIQLKIRARRIHQCAGEDRWEFRDDAGSGIRGKPHSTSMFRFSAFLDESSDDEDEPVAKISPIVTPEDIEPSYYDVRVWSKGNCPDRKKRKKVGLVKAEILLVKAETLVVERSHEPSCFRSPSSRSSLSRHCKKRHIVDDGLINVSI
jgi:hypothetical protein